MNSLLFKLGATHFTIQIEIIHNEGQSEQSLIRYLNCSPWHSTNFTEGN